MPRPLVFGNQSLLVAVDERHRIRDLIWPMSEGVNHLCGKAVAWGVYADGRMSWVDSPEWTITMAYEDGALVARCVLENSALGIRIETEEACAPERDIFFRKAKVMNLRDEPRTIKVYWNHEFLIGESNIGNTALYHPDLKGFLHYKRGHAILVFCAGPGPDEWSCGVRFEPGTGSWTQCAQGRLDMKGREVGAVDSTLGRTLHLEAGGAAEVDWGLACSESSFSLGSEFGGLDLESIMEDRRDADSDYLAPMLRVPDWPELDQAARRAALIVQTQTALNGAILAANDSDGMTHNTLNYTNVWPRDGALVSEALHAVNLAGAAEEFLHWCLQVGQTEGFFEQKYQPTGQLGVGWHPMVRDGQRVLPIQLDETALPLSLAARCFGDFEPEYQALVQKELVDPCLSALRRYRDADGLPLASWDLWEERRGVSFFAACSAAKAFQDWGLAEEAEQVKQAMLRRMVGPDGAFARQINEDGSLDLTADSALVGGLLMGLFPWDAEVVVKTLDKGRAKLMEPLPRRDVARYEGDYYHRVAEGYPGSPWILCTLWLGQAEVLRGRREEGRRLIQTALDQAAPTGVLSESTHPLTAAPLSVSPLTWSHAEVLQAAAAWRDSAPQG